MSTSNVPDWQGKDQPTSNTYIWVSAGVFALLMICVAAAFCGLGYWTLQNGVAGDTEPEAEPEAAAQQDDLLESLASDPGWTLMVDEGFDDNENNWDTGPYENDNVTLSRTIEDGKYTWDVESNAIWEFWAFAEEGEVVEDFVATVEIKHLEGHSLEGFGLILRAYEDEFYVLRFDDQGHAGFFICSPDKCTALMERTTTAIKPGDVNEITVQAQGSRFTFYINGQQISSIEDDRLPRGYVGIMMSTSGMPESTLNFNSDDDQYHPTRFEIDNFKIWIPVVGGAALEELVPEKGSIVFVSDADGNREIYSIDSDGSGVDRLTSNPADDVSPKWSPDGRRIAFVSTRDQNPEIYVMDADGTGVTRITDDPADDLSPAWSPDGTQIIFSSNRDGNHEIYIHDLDTDEETRITNDPSDNIHPDWSPDEKLIIFKTTQYGSIRICTFNMETNETIIVSVRNPAADSHPVFSSNGERLLYESGLLQGDTGIGISDIDSKNNIELVSREGLNMWPAWSPADEQVAFVSDRDGQTDIYIISLDGKSLYRLTDNDANESEIDWVSK